MKMLLTLMLFVPVVIFSMQEPALTVKDMIERIGYKDYVSEFNTWTEDFVNELNREKSALTQLAKEKLEKENERALQKYKSQEEKFSEMFQQEMSIISEKSMLILRTRFKDHTFNDILAEIVFGKGVINARNKIYFTEWEDLKNFYEGFQSRIKNAGDIDKAGIKKEVEEISNLIHNSIKKLQQAEPPQNFISKELAEDSVPAVFLKLYESGLDPLLVQVKDSDAALFMEQAFFHQAEFLEKQANFPYEPLQSYFKNLGQAFLGAIAAAELNAAQVDLKEDSKRYSNILRKDVAEYVKQELSRKENQKEASKVLYLLLVAFFTKTRTDLIPANNPDANLQQVVNLFFLPVTQIFCDAYSAIKNNNIEKLTQKLNNQSLADKKLGYFAKFFSKKPNLWWSALAFGSVSFLSAFLFFKQNIHNFFGHIFASASGSDTK